MKDYYSLMPVVSNNTEFALSYNRHAVSIKLLSECMTVDVFKQLMNEGAQFSKITFLNCQDSDILKMYDESMSWDKEFQPTISKLEVTCPILEMVSHVHENLQAKGSSLYEMG